MSEDLRSSDSGETDTEEPESHFLDVIYALARAIQTTDLESDEVGSLGPAHREMLEKYTRRRDPNQYRSPGMDCLMAMAPAKRLEALLNLDNAPPNLDALASETIAEFWAKPSNKARISTSARATNGDHRRHQASAPREHADL